MCYSNFQYNSLRHRFQYSFVQGNLQKINTGIRQLFSGKYITITSQVNESLRFFVTALLNPPTKAISTFTPRFALMYLSPIRFEYYNPTDNYLCMPCRYNSNKVYRKEIANPLRLLKWTLRNIIIVKKKM